jgi:hypothetical protein
LHNARLCTRTMARLQRAHEFLLVSSHLLDLPVDDAADERVDGAVLALNGGLR